MVKLSSKKVLRVVKNDNKHGAARWKGARVLQEDGTRSAFYLIAAKVERRASAAKVERRASAVSL